MFVWMRFTSSPLLVEHIVCEAHVLASAVGGLYSALGCWFLALDIGCGEMAASAIAYLLAFGAIPLPLMAEDASWIDIEVPEETTIAEEGCTFITSSTSPFWVVNAAQMA